MTKIHEHGKLCLILLWVVWPAGLIWYLVDKEMQKDEFVKFHFKQWLLTVIVMVAGNFIAGALSTIIIGVILFPILMVLGLLWFIQALIFILKEEKKELWLIGQYGSKLNF